MQKVRRFVGGCILAGRRSESGKGSGFGSFGMCRIEGFANTVPAGNCRMFDWGNQPAENCLLDGCLGLDMLNMPDLETGVGTVGL